MSKRLKQWLLSALVLGLLIAAAIGYGFFIEPQRLVVTPYELKIAGWDPEFDGMKFVLLGDIHGGSNYVTEERIRKVVELVNAQEADVVVMLGDFVSQVRGTGSLEQRPLKMEPEVIGANLTGLEATKGVYAVLGNHDGWFGDDRVAAALTEAGIKVLQNEVSVIRQGGAALRIVGLRDHLKMQKSWRELSAQVGTLAASAGPGPIIILEHSPDLLPAFTGERLISPDLKLYFAAHTHGGQIRLPVLGRPVIPSSLGQKYAYGHVRDRGIDMVVTSGIGMSVLPFRFMVPPEIAVVTVRSGN